MRCEKYMIETRRPVITAEVVISAALFAYSFIILALYA